jgi:Sortase domain
LRQTEWRRIAGLRVVMSWPEDRVSPPPRASSGRAPGRYRARLAGVAGVFLIIGGALAMIVALSTQKHAPQPAAGAAGATGPSAVRLRGPWLRRRSMPVSIAIPAIGVKSQLLRLGISTDGAMQVPALPAQAADAAWYEYSAAPGQIGASVIEGHVDSYQGPAVFFRLGALRPGNRIDVTLADGITAVFRVTGVREYAKSRFPARAVYDVSNYAGLRLITCGGVFDYTTRHYLSSTVVFASLMSSRVSSRRAVSR